MHDKLIHALDSNIFFAYCFLEHDCHDKAVALFASGIKLYSAAYVQKEIDKICHRRQKLLKEIYAHLGRYPDLKSFEPSVELKDRDWEYLEELRDKAEIVKFVEKQLDCKSPKMRNAKRPARESK